MVKVIDKNGQPLPDTARNGKVRRLLKEGKARVVNGNPFTIQLLYDTTFETEDATMHRIIVTNDTRIPSTIMTDNATIMTYSEFISAALTNEGLEVDEVYFDVDDLDEGVYEQVKNTDLDKISYFRFRTTPIIKEDVIIVDATDDEPVNKFVDRSKELDIKFTDDFTTHGNILIAGLPASGKTTLIKNIVAQLESRNIEIEFATPVPIYDAEVDTNEIYNHTMNVKELAKMLANCQAEMMNRFKLMERAGVNSAYKLKAHPVKTKIIIIDGLNEYMCADDYKSIDTIKQSLGSIARLGRAAGIMFIVTCQRPNGSTISTDLLNNIMNRICVGHISDDSLSQLLFDEQVRIKVPFGMGIYQNTSNGAAEYSVFNIDDVKKFK